MSEETRTLMDRFFRLESLTRRYMARRHMRQDPAANPHRGQGRVLALLKMQPEISQRELAYLLGMRGQSLGELLTKLERNGYITRTPVEDDRRAMMVRLTPEGEAAAAEARHKQKKSDPVFDCLSAEEQKQLIGYLDRLIAALEAQEEGDEGDMPSHDGKHPHHPHHGRFEDGRGWGPDCPQRGCGPRPPHGRGPMERRPEWRDMPGEPEDE